MKAIILARVSTQEQESIPAQIQRLQPYIQRKELEVFKTFEIKESSTKDTRKKFEKVIELIRASEEPIALVTDTIDRVQRSFKESVVLDELRKAGKLELHFYRENLRLHKDSNSADLIRWDMGVMFAKNYVLQISDNVKRTAEKKILDGIYPGKAPVGYLNVNKDDYSISTKRNYRDCEKWIIPDPDRKDFVIKFFEMYATGEYSTLSLARILRKEGFTTRSGNSISKSTLFDILVDPFYYGEMLFKGKIYRHKYEPLITKWLWDKCQQIRESYNKKPFKFGLKEFVFKGLIQCSECESMLSSYTKKGINYVRCHNCKKIHLREDIFLKQVQGIFKKFIIPEDKLEKVTETIKRNHENEQNFYESQVRGINQKLSTVKKRMKVMYDDRLDGRITRDEYDKRIVEMKTNEQDLLEQLKEHSKADERFLISSSYLLELANNAYKLFENSQIAQKRKLLNFVFANLKARGEKLVYELKNPFDELVFAYETKEWLPGSGSNRRPSGYTYPNVSNGGGLYHHPF